MHHQLLAQGVTAKAPPAEATPNAGTPGGIDAVNTLPDAPDPTADVIDRIPVAKVLPDSKAPEMAVIESDNPQSLRGDVYFASGNVVLTYQDHILHADSIRYNRATGEVEFLGHAKLTGGQNDEYIEASRGTYNVRTGTGRFYDVHGSVGLEQRSARSAANGAAQPASTTGAIVGAPIGPASRTTYANSNPFLFEGKIVVKTGPTDYTVYEGSVTSCLMPKPDWQIFAKKITLDKGKAHAAGSTFKLLGIPLLFMPYVTHPVDAEERQSGLLIPELSFSRGSATAGSKGLTIGEQGYLTLGRSADMTIGLLYYSDRGFSENGTVRVRGQGNNFATGHFSALEDRGFHYQAATLSGQLITLYANQGGEDVTAAFRYDFTPKTRLVGDVEYLSSYVYREAFTENFNQAVSSDINSVVFVTQQTNGYALSARFDRYEGLKVVPTYRTAGQEVKIFHAPALDFDAIDRAIPGTPFKWNVATSIASMKRVQPNFVTAGMTERFDLRPELSLPMHFDGFNLNASIAARETVYSRSRQVPYGPNPANAVPIELMAPVNRADVEMKLDFRPPVIERDFKVPAKLQSLFGDEVRHTVESHLTYRDVKGVDNFLAILRFDDTDLVSDTNELEYGVTQHLYFKPHPKVAKLPPGCSASPLTKAVDDKDAEPAPREAQEDPDQQPSIDANGIPNPFSTAPDVPTRTHKRHAGPCDKPTAVAGQTEWFSWDLKQKIFFDQNFGGAVINSRRNIFETTLDLSGIAFLTEARNISPLISRMRFRTSGHTDIEYDFDYDTGASKFTSQNILLDVHESNLFGGVSYARLNAPGRFHSEVLNQTTNTATQILTTQISNFQQMRLLGGFGAPTRAGLSVAAGAGLDLNPPSGAGMTQYLTIQASYNWNCCGLSVEYRKYDLGNIRDEGTESFNFTLANIGSAGNMRRAQSLF
ncbi:LPS-assembly protein [Bryocella elongata]|uniref:LPS-assembly protein n=1 Tax=Bryocella elongata TaxID=863522 RepID=A0A1H5YL09_9BACT|nr:LPS assembly protein LptD [Bryocella elongata]SEG24684.1 LPS-assembly protein [Bryocella elongata]